MFSFFKKKKTENFKFKESENTACFTCDHVLIDKVPILHVTHDSDGSWQFLCGFDNHTESNAKVISLKQATNIDQTINDLFEMPPGVAAERASIVDKWKPFRL